MGENSRKQNAMEDCRIQNSAEYQVTEKWGTEENVIEQKNIKNIEDEQNNNNIENWNREEYKIVEC